VGADCIPNQPGEGQKVYQNSNGFRLLEGFQPVLYYAYSAELPEFFVLCFMKEIYAKY